MHLGRRLRTATLLYAELFPLTTAVPAWSPKSRMKSTMDVDLPSSRCLAFHASILFYKPWKHRMWPIGTRLSKSRCNNMTDWSSSNPLQSVGWNMMLPVRRRKRSLQITMSTTTPMASTGWARGHFAPKHWWDGGAGTLDNMKVMLVWQFDTPTWNDYMSISRLVHFSIGATDMEFPWTLGGVTVYWATSGARTAEGADEPRVENSTPGQSKRVKLESITWEEIAALPNLQLALRFFWVCF